ncbi:MAG: hypothetical protein ABSF67_16425 [Roseiarcus sp.]|jgi:hypothetical protein
MIAPAIHGDEHWKPDDVVPFGIGDVNPSGSFVHVLDDASLDIALRELDTITDFTAYLTKKEALVRSGKLIVAGGEEDLVAYYMTHINGRGEHDFTMPDGSSLGPKDSIGLQTGFYADLVRNKKYLAKKKEDQMSYVWDHLIEAFTTNILNGTTILPDGRPFVLSEIQEGVRHMAIVPRHIRRILGASMLDAFEKAKTTDRFTRAFLPEPEGEDQGTGYFLMTLAPPGFELAGGYEQYCSVRRAMLETYALAFLQKHPRLKVVVGIATEPPSEDSKAGSSEDLIVVPMPEWSPALSKRLEEKKRLFNIVQPRQYTEYAIQSDEFPESSQQHGRADFGTLNRKQRRAKVAEERKRTQKGK